jgi:hypothetical protein
MTVRLHIDRLVLEGLDVRAGSRGTIAGAVEQELARLIANGGLAPSLAGGAALPSVAGGSIAATGSPTGLGAAIAGAVYDGVGGRAPGGRTDA